MEITNEIIREDIEEFQEQIRGLKDKLDALPGAAATYNDRKKLKAKRLGIEADIRHIKGLIRLANGRDYSLPRHLG